MKAGKEIGNNKLLLAVSENDRGSFNLFYNIYYEQVFRFAYYFLKEKEACREVVTDVFFSVWQSRKQLRKVANIDTYLYIATRNECRRFMSKRDRRHISMEELPVHLEKSEDISPENEIVNQEIERLLAQAISELPERCRIIFLMVREEGLKPKQIAEILSIKESTIRVQMRIAIEKIIEVVKPYFPDITFKMLLCIIFNGV